MRLRSAWECAFPPASDVEQIDNAMVVLVVAVDASGRPRWVRVTEDPGYGFGQAATQCAMGMRYDPALDERGIPIQGLSPPIRLRFTR